MIEAALLIGIIVGIVLIPFAKERALKQDPGAFGTRRPYDYEQEGL